MNVLILLIVLAVLFGGFGYSPYGEAVRPFTGYGLGGILVIILILYLLGLIR